ncbi:MAG TPA: hypothetical protein DSN98_07675 [Thermoplasmata archaeon]|jgi:hypothetical protein|nr:MAG TPA: hypothetical protein DSN98_07675 [Thermoplasmata archaeon]
MMELKRILAVGVILLFIGVTVAPTINFQVVKASTDINSIENQKNNSPQLLLKKIHNYQIKNIVNYLRHLILLRIIEKLNDLRFSVYRFLYDFSTKIVDHNDYFPRIIHPLVFFLACIVFLRIHIGKYFWFDISQLFHWGWTYEDILGSPYLD